MSPLASSQAAPWQIRTRPNRHYPFLSRHPWVLANALAIDTLKANPDGDSHEAVDAPERPQCGDVIDLLDHDGNWVARGLINPSSRLRIRLYVFSAGEAIDDDLWSTRIDQAIARRRLRGPGNPEGGERLIFSESDRISGLIVDRYADCLSIQFTGAVLIRRAEHLIAQVIRSAAEHGTPCHKALVRMDENTLKHEGVQAPVHETLQAMSTLAAETSTESDSGGDGSSVWYRHNDLQMAIDLQDGQKTGGYLDQQDNHAAAAKYMAGRRVLDVCTYTGGFALSAARAGAARVVGVDSSERALAIARRNADRNQLGNLQFDRGDCFDDLKARHENGEQFDAVILDPPRFAGSRNQTDAALRAYSRLNASAIDLLPPGGILVTCSCSGRVSRADFLNMLVDVGRKRGRDLIVLESRGPSPDHVFAVACPESDYLKCIIAQVV